MPHGKVMLDGAHADVVRSLAALAPNKVCMDCNSPDVSHVCTTFSTFVCARCAVMLGQLGFVTKPLGRIARAKFTREDVVGLLQQGNKEARAKWHGNDAGMMEIPDSEDRAKVAQNISLR